MQQFSLNTLSKKDVTILLFDGLDEIPPAKREICNNSF